MHKTLTARLIGFIASLLLTLTTFLIVFNPEFFHLRGEMNIATIFILAILQALVQAICFLNIWGEKGPRWNLVIFVSTISIILIIILGSVWIMNHLDYNMSISRIGSLKAPLFLPLIDRSALG